MAIKLAGMSMKEMREHAAAARTHKAVAKAEHAAYMKHHAARMGAAPDPIDTTPLPKPVPAPGKTK
jgi:hypothetical protein